jgi:hypothetical protein
MANKDKTAIRRGAVIFIKRLKKFFLKLIEQLKHQGDQKCSPK